MFCHVLLPVQGAKGAKTAKAAKKTTAGGAGGDDIYIDTEENADGKGPEAKGSGRGAKVSAYSVSQCETRFCTA